MGYFELRGSRYCGVYRNRAMNTVLKVLASFVLRKAEEVLDIFVVECPEILQALLTGEG